MQPRLSPCALGAAPAETLLRVGSIANLIVADLARRNGVVIEWRPHAATGVPVTLGTRVLAWLWLS